MEDTLRQTRKLPPADYRADSPFLQLAIDEARWGIHLGHGGPFGSVIVKDGQVIGRGHNMVLANHDSTAHGEISAIRAAEAALGTHDLSGCQLYTTGEPCPMCLAACLWANIERVYYGCTIGDNGAIGFRDAKLDALMGGRELLADYLIPLDRPACLRLFEEYAGLNAKRY